MKKGIFGVSSLAGLAVLAGVMSLGPSLSAQDATAAQTQQPQSQPSTAPDQAGQPASTPDSQTQSAPSQTSPSQNTPDQSTPDQTAPSTSTPPASSTPTTSSQPDDAKAAPTSGGQTFMGTVVKSGDKYVLQDASGTTYDIDHQDEVSKFEGKKVRVRGTLDASGKMIHVQ